MENNLQKKTKKSLIEALQQKVDIGILEQTNFELLKKLMNNASTVDEALQIQQFGIYYNNTGLKYKPELENNNGNKIYYLEKDSKKSFDNGGNHHKLIIGDNYHCLRNLLITHKNKIDVIYIDPPYGCNDMGKFAETNYKNNITRDYLLSMLHPRLKLAKELMSDNGVIFCSIDDKNYAYVKLLFDEVFGENNFSNTIIWQRHTGGGMKKGIITGHDYVICYHNKQVVLLNSKKEDEPTDWTHDGKNYRRDANPVRKEFGNKRGSIDEIYYNIKNLSENGYEKIEDNIYSKNVKGEIKYFIIGKTKDRDVLYRLLPNNGTKKMYSIQNCDGGLGIDMLISILSDCQKEQLSAMYPKPVEMIITIINLLQNKNCIVLDFFAGSGTTGQAVLELNKDDGGNRQYILCTLDENNIPLSITYERLLRIMTGKTSKEEDDFDWIKKNQPYGDSLDVYYIKDIEYTSNDVFDKIKPEDYDVNDKKEIKQKIEWICENFDNCCGELEEKIEGKQKNNLW